MFSVLIFLFDAFKQNPHERLFAVLGGRATDVLSELEKALKRNAPGLKIFEKSDGGD